MNKRNLWGIFLCILGLTGCAQTEISSGVETWVKEQIKTQAHIAEDPDYLQAQKLQQGAQLEEDGTYKTGLNAEEVIPTGAVHVTFASNCYFTMEYYYDADYTCLVDTSNCYMEPGALLYAAEPVYADLNSDQYVFDGLRVAEYNEDGSRGKVHEQTNVSDNIILEIPLDVTEISIEPYGHYERRELATQVYWADGDGDVTMLDGEWLVNGKAYNPENKLDSTESYTVVLHYDAEKYYFVGCEPEAFYTEGGIVEFTEVQPTEGVDSYRVELHPYTNMQINNDVKKLIALSVEGEGKDVSNKTITLPQLCAGDVVTLVSKDAYKITESGVTVPDAEKTEDGYRFVITIPQDGLEEMALKVEKWDERTISPVIDHFDFGESFSHVLDNMPWSQPQTSLLTVYAGENTYTYEDLRSGEKIQLREPYSLEIEVNPEQLEENQLLTVQAGGTTNMFRKGMEAKSFTVPYERATELQISLSEEQEEA